MSVFLFLAAALVATPAQQPIDRRRSATDAARAFTLDSVAPPPKDVVAAPAADQSATPPSPSPAPAPAAARPASPSWLDIPIASLIANPTTRAVLDRDLPGLTADENLPKFASKSLRQFQPLTGGQLTDALLQKVQADISVAPPPPKAKNRRGER